MLSRLAFRTGAFSPLLTSELRQGSAALWLRCASTEVAKPPPASPAKAASADGDVDESNKTLANWEKANQIYFGPERDHVNFPIIKMEEHHPPVRMGFIPDSWFKFFYEKTGVTGPYVFGTGLLTFLLSKEILVVEHNFTYFISFWIAFYIMAKKYGKQIGKYLDETGEAVMQRLYYKPVANSKKQAEDTIGEMEKFIWSEEGQKQLFESKRENVDLQLESTYRQRLQEAYQNVKKRLDYQVELEGAQRRVQQEHMVKWIVDSVVTGITPQQERDTLTKCIQDLKAMSKKAATV